MYVRQASSEELLFQGMMTTILSSVLQHKKGCSQTALYSHYLLGIDVLLTSRILADIPTGVLQSERGLAASELNLKSLRPCNGLTVDTPLRERQCWHAVT